MEGVPLMRLIFAIVFGLVLGGIIHIVTVLGLPRFAADDAFTRVAGYGPDYRFNPIPRPGSGTPTLPLLDPAFAQYVCRFDLEDGPVRIRGAMPDTFWTVAVFDGHGVNTYNLSDRSFGQKPLDILVADAEQIAQIRENPPADFNDLIIVDWKADDGFAVLRIFAPNASDQRDADASIAKATCQTAPLG
ncbi:hypothetical protein C2U72_16820 [Prosthecomicrobium hirschii]|nr:hypothetical protein C2U72_16820 [Prosthecomicrobium hirschii]